MSGDVVAAFLAAADRSRPGTWNIGTGAEVSVLELARMIGAVAGRPADPQFAPMRPGELQRSAIAVERAERDLGWSAGPSPLADGDRGRAAYRADSRHRVAPDRTGYWRHARAAPLAARMPRPDGRRPDQLREVRMTRGWLDHAEGSVLVEFGATRVLCAASVTEELPRWRRGSGLGWVTAEYAMLPQVHEHAQRPGVGEGPGRRPHPGDLAAGRPVPAGLHRSQGARR